MTRIVLLVLVACAASPGAPAYPLHPTLRSASGGPILVIGAVARPCAVPYTPGLSLRTVLRMAGGPRHGSRRGRVTRTLAGREHVYAVPIDDILVGAAPDLELAPGDVVEVPDPVRVD